MFCVVYFEEDNTWALLNIGTGIARRTSTRIKVTYPDRDYVGLILKTTGKASMLREMPFKAIIAKEAVSHKPRPLFIFGVAKRCTLVRTDCRISTTCATSAKCSTAPTY